MYGFTDSKVLTWDYEFVVETVKRLVNVEDICWLFFVVDKGVLLAVREWKVDKVLSFHIQITAKEVFRRKSHELRN